MKRYKEGELIPGYQLNRAHNAHWNIDKIICRRGELEAECINCAAFMPNCVLKRKAKVHKTIILIRNKELGLTKKPISFNHNKHLRN
jgi:hypothetical protein